LLQIIGIFPALIIHFGFATTLADDKAGPGGDLIKNPEEVGSTPRQSTAGGRRYTVASVEKARRSTLSGLMATAAMSKNPQSWLVLEVANQRLISTNVDGGCHTDCSRPSVAFFSADDFSELRRDAAVEISIGDDGLANDDDGVPMPHIPLRSFSAAGDRHLSYV